MGKKREHHEEHENHERWVVSYADFMTLLFAFFVVMYATGRADVKKQVRVENSIRFAMAFEGTGGVGELPLFEGPPSEGGCAVDIGHGGRLSRDERKKIDAFRKKLDKRLRHFLEDSERPKAITVEMQGDRLAIRMSARRFFDPGAAALRPSALPVLDALAEELVRLKKPISVEGHTDTMPYAGQRYRDNWELSASRAAAVVSYLVSAHPFEPSLLSATGHGDTQPIRTDGSPEAREANRRIELVIRFDPGDGEALSAL